MRAEKSRVLVSARWVRPVLQLDFSQHLIGMQPATPAACQGNAANVTRMVRSELEIRGHNVVAPHQALQALALHAALCRGVGDVAVVAPEQGAQVLD